MRRLTNLALIRLDLIILFSPPSARRGRSRPIAEAKGRRASLKKIVQCIKVYVKPPYKWQTLSNVQKQEGNP